MLERASGLADVLADYYRNNQQACRPGLAVLGVYTAAAMLDPCTRFNYADKQRLNNRRTKQTHVLEKFVLTTQVSLWLLNRRRTAEREGSEAAAASPAGEASGAAVPTDQLSVTDASGLGAASAEGTSA